MTPSEALPIIRSACAKIVERGGLIAPCYFHDETTDSYCPIGATGATSPLGVPREFSFVKRAARALGISVEQALAVAIGFDGAASDGIDAEWALLGRALRREWDEGGLR